jgi:enoyl-CoA hydratase/carnithine racemase
LTDQPRPPEGDWLGTPFLRFERHGPLAHVVVDRPAMRNALSPAMYFGLRYAVDHVNRDPALAGLLVTGTGDVFIPGGEMGGANEDGWADLPTLLAMDNTPFETIRRSPKPVVCAVNGIAQGGGLMIAMLADVAVASDRATGRTVTAAEALDWGLVARVVPHDRLLAEATEVLAACCRTAPEARRAVKRTLHEYYGHYDRMAMDQSLSGPEMLEGFRAFKEHRPPGWVPEGLP